MRTSSLALLLPALSFAPLHAQDSTAARSARPDTMVLVPVGARIGTEVQRQLRTRQARPGDSLLLMTSFPVVVDGRTAIPAGTFIVAVLDSPVHRHASHRRLALDLHVASLVFPSGDVVAAAIPARAGAHRDTGLRDDERPGTGPIVAGVGVAAAGVGLGVAAHGEQGAKVGAVAGSVALMLGSLVWAWQGRSVVLDVGLPIDLTLRDSLALDARLAAAAATAGTGLSVVARPKLCYRPAIPGTPDVTIPGDPGTPPTADSPGTPATPATVIPGTPGVPARWERCR